MQPKDDSLNAVFWRDEILQILYWLRGEGLGEAVCAQNLLAFLDLDGSKIQALMEEMHQEGYLSALEDAPGFYQLSEWGLGEGKRQFAAEFAGMTHQGHGECNDPDCACHVLGPAACEGRLAG